MYKTFILIIYTLILSLEFIIEVAKKKISVVDVLIRAFMIISFPLLCTWF